MPSAPQQGSRSRLLDAALSVVRTKGFAATRIDDICAEAGLTKGSFFHHFKSKEDLALAAVAHWDAFTSALFAGAPYHEPRDPLDRLLGYVDFRKTLLHGEIPEITCFAGTIIQEAYITHPAISAACERNVSGHANSLVADIAAAKEACGIDGAWTADSLALYIQSVVQGALLLTKAKGGAQVAEASLDHLRRYLVLLFKGEST